MAWPGLLLLLNQDWQLMFGLIPTQRGKHSARGQEKGKHSALGREKEMKLRKGRHSVPGQEREPMMMKRDKLSVPGQEREVIMMMKRDKLSVPGQEREVTMRMKRDKLSVPGQEREVTTKMKRDKLSVPGQEREVTMKMKRDKLSVPGQERGNSTLGQGREVMTTKHRSLVVGQITTTMKKTKINSSLGREMMHFIHQSHASIHGWENEASTNKKGTRRKILGVSSLVYYNSISTNSSNKCHKSFPAAQTPSPTGALTGTARTHARHCAASSLEASSVRY